MRKELSEGMFQGGRFCMLIFHVMSRSGKFIVFKRYCKNNVYVMEV
jgi:hypothetical protein